MHTDLKVWLDHFEYHASRRCAMPEGAPEDFTPYERRLIAESLARFQLAEQLEAGSLLRAARRHERAYGAAPLARILSLRIAEEQHHVALLGAFMDQHGLARRHSGWMDRLFRRARRLASFELHISMLITTELMAKVYLRALEAATGCRQLQTLCRMLVADELAHVGFESDLLRAMHSRRGPLLRKATEQLHRAFYSSAALVSWLAHRRVLRSAGYCAATFFRACAAQYAFYLEPPPIAARSAFMTGMTRLEENGGGVQ
jgi:hypothetical protein